MEAPITERRAHLRVETPCPVSLFDTRGQQFAEARAENVSDGGLFVVTPIETIPKFGSELQVAFKLPRSTANTFMYEKVKCKAKVTRHQPLVDTDQAGVALKFSQPLELMLEM